MERERFNRLHWSSENDISDCIPVIDLKILQKEIEGDCPADQQIMLPKLTRILENTGGFYLKNHNVSEEKIEHFHRVTQDFFNKPLSEKTRISNAGKGIQGYVGLGKESTDALFNNGKDVDLCEKFSMTNQNDIFPDAAFEAQWKLYHRELMALANQLGLAIGRALNLAAGDLLKYNEMVGKGYGFLRFLNYPDISDLDSAMNANKTQMGKHTDYCLFGINFQTPALNGFNALRVKVNNSFVEIPAIKDAFFIHIGRVSDLLLEDKLIACEHFVAKPVGDKLKNSHRTSASLFFMTEQGFDELFGAGFPEKDEFQELTERHDSLYQ